MSSAIQFGSREHHALAIEDASRFATRHYSCAEIASLWNVSADFIHKIFEKEPGVLVLGDPRGSKGKRAYTTLRIPEDILQRVHKRLSKV